MPPGAQARPARPVERAGLEQAGQAAMTGGRESADSKDLLSDTGMKYRTEKWLKLIVAIVALALFASSGSCRRKTEKLNKPPDNANAAAPAPPVSQSGFAV